MYVKLLATCACLRYHVSLIIYLIFRNANRNPKFVQPSSKKAKKKHNGSNKQQRANQLWFCLQCMDLEHVEVLFAHCARIFVHHSHLVQNCGNQNAGATLLKLDLFIVAAHFSSLFHWVVVSLSSSLFSCSIYLLCSSNWNTIAIILSFSPQRTKCVQYVRKALW